MEMWNWFMELYSEGYLPLEDLEEAMTNDRAARVLWEDWSEESSDFIDFVRDEIRPFIKYVKETKAKDE